MRFLFVDRILQLIPGKLTRGIKHVTHDDAFLSPDETGRLVFPSSLVGETLGQLAAWNVMMCNGFSHRPVAGIVAKVHVHRSVYVNDTVLLESVIDSLDEAAVQYHSVAYVGDEVVFTIEGALGPLLPMEQFIDEDVVRRQFTEINRPGDWPVVTPQSSHVVSLEAVSHVRGIDCHMAFDEVIEFIPTVSIKAVKKITKAAPYFPDHFPRRPVLPMTVLLESKLNLARTFLKQSGFSKAYHITELSRIKMNDFVHPGDVLTCFMQVREQDEHHLVLRCLSEVEGKRVCVLDLQVSFKD